MPVYPRDALATPPTAIWGSCFVLMPFDKKFNPVLSVIEQACKSLQLSCSRADDVARAGHVMERVLNGILQAEYIIADLTGKNPNVFYELGIAHSCKPPSNVIMISQNPEDVPFDLRSMNYLTYRSNGPGREQLERQLTEALQGEGYRFSIRHEGSYHFADGLSGRHGNHYTFEIKKVLVSPRDAKIFIQVQSHVVGGPSKRLEARREYLATGTSRIIASTDFQIRLDRVAERRAYFSVLRRSSPKRKQDARAASARRT